MRAATVRSRRPGAPGSRGHQVHGEQDLVVVGGPAGGGEHMRVVDPQRLLAHEAQQRVGVALQQHLRRHIAATAVVPGAPDRAHTPRPIGSTSSYRAKTSPMAVLRSSPEVSPCLSPRRAIRLPRVPVFRPHVSPAAEPLRPPGGASALVRLVVRDRVGRAAGSVDPEELRQLRVCGGEESAASRMSAAATERSRDWISRTTRLTVGAPELLVVCVVLVRTEPPGTS